MKKCLPLLALLALCGCMRPYDTPEFVEVQHHETAYLIPLEGENEDGQTKFDSEDYLEKNRVAIKRVQVPHRWVQTGRFWPSSGEYIDTVRVVVVNRQPVSASWTADDNAGTSSKNEAIWLESADSISFSLGFNCTAFIDEKDTTKFLYMYPTTVPKAVADEEELAVDVSSAGLAHVMNKEIRSRIQTLANIVAARFDLDDLRREKDQILYAVRNGIPEKKNENGEVEQDALEGVISHFANRGITITDLGMFGGFEYNDKEIQEAINETFIAQQEKVRTEAAFEAQAKKNDRIELEAKATANKQREIAQGAADAIRIEAEAEAAAIRAVAEAAKEAGQDPLFLELKKLEVETGRVEKWDGKYPNYLMNLGGGEKPNLLLQVPAK